MQTRADFLATGLVPVPAKKATEDDCAICFSELSDPVQTPCGHIFDKACIEQWLHGQKHNTCPLCKAEFFALPREETLSRREVLRQQVGQALGASNLISRAPPFHHFGSMEYNISALQRAAANVTDCLAQGTLPPAGQWVHHDSPGNLQRIAGPCLIDVHQLSPAFIAIANMLPALAAVQGEPFDARAQDMWYSTMCILWSHVIKPLHGKRADALVLAEVLKQKTRAGIESRLYPYRVLGLSFFDGHRKQMLNTLLDYLTLRCWQFYKVNESQKRKERETQKKRKEAKAEPKMSSRFCGVM